MAIRLEFINLIVPIRIIEQKYPGGWLQLREDTGLEGDATQAGSYWHDTHLFRDGAMNPTDMALMVHNLENLGFVGLVDVDGKKQWQDFCVISGREPIDPCPWLKISKYNGTAYYRKIKAP